MLGPLTPEHMEMFLRNPRFLGIQAGWPEGFRLASGLERLQSWEAVFEHMCLLSWRNRSRIARACQFPDVSRPETLEKRYLRRIAEAADAAAEGLKDDSPV